MLAKPLMGEIRKFNCKGEIVSANEYEINVDGIFNARTIVNILYVNDRDDSNTGGIHAYDLCIGDELGYYCLNGDDTTDDWGFYVDPYTNLLYATEGYTDAVIPDLWVFDPLQETLNTEGVAGQNCIDPLISAGTDGLNIGDSELPDNPVFGVVTDVQGNIYFIGRGLAQEGTIYKYFPTGVLLAQSVTDFVEGDGGYAKPAGIVYVESLNLLYVSTESFTDDCVSLFDTDLNYLGSADPATGTGSDRSKAIAKTIECCPTLNIQEIDQAFCVSDFSELLFLNEVFECEGTICEGLWTEVSSAPSVTFNECDQSISLNDAGCGTFSKVSDGAGDNALCGAFNITLNVCFDLQPTAPTISVTDNVCEPVSDGSINIDTPCSTGSTIEYSTDAGITWSAAALTYNTASSISVRARCVAGGCASEETADLTSKPEVCDTCPPVNCIRQYGEFTMIKRIP